jgi:DNA-binding response OmpR family regulator
MEYLWQHRDRTVTYDELLSALYGDNKDDRGDPRSSLDKIVRRLRALLEPGLSGSRTYIDVQPGVGYVLRNIRIS